MLMMFFVERVRGIEPLSFPWQGNVLPLNHTRVKLLYQIFWCRAPESNWARLPLQGSALPMS